MMNAPLKSWMTLNFPPERYEPLEVQLADQSVCRAVWTGSQWWSDGREVKPQAWRPVRSAFEADSMLRSA